jgi:hypothetical protein
MFHFGLSDKRVTAKGLQAGPLLGYRSEVLRGRHSVRFRSKADMWSGLAQTFAVHATKVIKAIRSFD